MSRHESIASEWRNVLAARGLEELPANLCDAAALDGLPGRWQALHKSGLGGRERWRWVLPVVAPRSASHGPEGDTQTRAARHPAGDMADEPPVIFVKRYRKATWRDHFDRWWRQNPWHGRGWWEFRQAEALAEASIAAPRAVLSAERMLGPFERCSVVGLDTVPGEAIDRAWPVWRAANAPVTRGWARHDLVVRLARFIAAFHHSGRCHRDLYLCHVFIQVDPRAAKPPEFAIIDLTRVFSPSWRRMRWIVKDLAQLDASARQLHATRSDRLRFLRAYLGLQRGSPRVRVYVRRVVRKSGAILARDARKRAARMGMSRPVTDPAAALRS